MIAERLVHVRIVGRDDGTELVGAADVVANHGGSVDAHILDLALIRLREDLGEGRGRLFRSAHILADEGPETEDTSDE